MKHLFTILIVLGTIAGLNAQEIIESENINDLDKLALARSTVQDSLTLASNNNPEKIDADAELRKDIETPSPDELRIQTILEEFRIYPNPTSSYINIFNPSRDFIEFSLKIMNSTGKEIYSRNNLYSSFPFRYNAENLEPGFYIIILSFDKTSISRKIMVE